MNIASLFAKVGFKIDENDLNKVKQSLTAVKNKIDELIASTAEFATTLTKLSKTTGISKKLLQDFHNLGIEAGVATGEVDSMLETMANVANKAYWGLGNQFAQWGLFFGRGETAASALMKTLNKLSVSSPQKQREIANEIGLQLDTALMLAERLKKGGFKTEDYFNLTDKEVDTMHDVNIQLAMMTHRLDNFWKKITATQGENQLRNFKVLNGLIQTILSGFVDLAETKTGTGLIDMFVTGVQVLTPLLDYSESVIGLAEKFFKNLKYFAVTFLGAGAGVLIAKLFGLSTRPLFNSLQEKLDNLINSDSHFGKSLKKTVSSVADFALDLINKYMPEIGKSLGLTEFFKQAKEGKIFTAFNTLIETLIKKLETLGKTIWNYIKNGLNKIIQSTLITSLSDFIDAMLFKLDVWVVKSFLLPLLKGLNKLPFVDYSDEIEYYQKLVDAMEGKSLADVKTILEDARNEEEKKEAMKRASEYGAGVGALVGNALNNSNDIDNTTTNWKDPTPEEIGEKLVDNYNGIISDVIASANEGSSSKQLLEYFGALWDTNVQPLGLPAYNSTANNMNQSNNIFVNGTKNQTPEDIGRCVVQEVEKLKKSGYSSLEKQALVANYCNLGGASAQ